ncbi:MAG TPA: glycosyltransferase family 2 protein [Gaiellaceae bacterium]|nr:glycosyltransferase family 2 protein [Gaiellaceae bacterium]
MRSEPNSTRSPGNVSAVIVNYEAGKLLLECISALAGQSTLLETIVVDNGSTDGSTEAAAAGFPDVHVVKPGRNLGFAGGGNAGARVARGELLLFLNPDVRLTPGSVSALAAEFTDPSVGVVGPPLDVAVADAVEYGATLDPIGSPVGLADRGPALYVPGCALMTRARLFHALGGFDERFFMFVEDVDYCWRVLLSGSDVRVARITPAQHEGGAAAPGGYLTAEGVTSTRFRVVLRERNTLAMLLKCYGSPLVWIVVPLYAVQSLATAVVLAAVGRRRTAIDIAGGLWWNLRELPRTVELRRMVQRSRHVNERKILKRMYRGLWKVTLLLRFGIPEVSEKGAPTSELAP